MVLLEILWINGNLLSLILAMQILEQPLINSYPSCGVLINQLLKTCLKFLLRYGLLATFWLLSIKLWESWVFVYFHGNPFGHTIYFGNRFLKILVKITDYISESDRTLSDVYPPQIGRSKLDL